jgi:hypothetical protein
VEIDECLFSRQTRNLELEVFYLLKDPFELWTRLQPEFDEVVAGHQLGWPEYFLWDLG